MASSEPVGPDDLPEWVPDEYDPEAPLEERLPVIAELEGGVELHVKDDRGVVEIVHQPQHFHENDRGMRLKAGTAPDDWTWEIVVPAEGPSRLERVDPLQPQEVYEKTKKPWMENVDVRVYGVDVERYFGGDE